MELLSFSGKLDALGAMESVAEHINEMQKIYEEYGGEFEQLMKIEKQERHLYKVFMSHISCVRVYVRECA